MIGLVIALFLIGVVVGIKGIRMERHLKRELAVRPTYDDLARDLEGERRYTSLVANALDDIRAAEQ